MLRHGFKRNLANRFVIILMISTYSIKSIVVSGAATSRLEVQIPSDLNSRTKQGYDHRDALFGIPPYGASIHEHVYYTTDLLCGSSAAAPGSSIPKWKQKKGDNVPQSYPDTKGKPWPHPFILMVDRGDCTFVQKVRNAQHGGAAAVLIADNQCQCGATNCVLDKGAICEAEEPIMADDGSGLDITIPSFLVFKQDADKMKEVLKKNKPMRVEMSFSIPEPEARVEYDLWTTPNDPVSIGFLTTFKEAAIALGDRAFFTPRDFVYDGVKAGCQSNGQNKCYSLCTNEGRYCSTNPPPGQNATGADIVAESLRRACIWKLYGQDGVGVQWWDYVSEFHNLCRTPTDFLFNNRACVSDAMSLADVNETDVNRCIEASGGLVKNAPNKIFDLQLNDKETAGAFLIPSIFINKAPIRGELEYATVFRGICAGYAKGYEPTICKHCANCLDEAGCVQQGGRCTAGFYEFGQPTVSIQMFAGVIAGLTLLFCFVVYCWHLRQQRVMNEQIRGIVAEYMPIASQNLNKDNTLGLEENDDEVQMD